MWLNECASKKEKRKRLPSCHKTLVFYVKVPVFLLPYLPKMILSVPYGFTWIPVCLRLLESMCEWVNSFTELTFHIPRGVQKLFFGRILWAELVLTWRVRFVVYYLCFIIRFSWIELRFVGLPCAQDRPGGESKARRVRWSNAVQCTRDQARCVYIKLTLVWLD